MADSLKQEALLMYGRTMVLYVGVIRRAIAIELLWGVIQLAKIAPWCEIAGFIGWTFKCYR